MRVVCAAVAIMAAGVAVKADPVIFHNPTNEFEWNTIYGGQDPWNGDGYLDITRPANDQPANGSSNRTVSNRHKDFLTSGDYWHSYVSGGSLITFAAGEAVTMTHYNQGSASNLTFRKPKLFQAGDVIGPGLDFNSAGFSKVGAVRDKQNKFVEFNFWEGLADEGYLALTLELNGQTHYGWIQVTKYTGKALSWAYESTPNTPLAIPVPAAGTLPVVGIAGLVATRRRR